MKTSELTGAALDWAVAKCEEATYPLGYWTDMVARGNYTPSTDWSQGGPIIERERIEFRQARTGMFASYPDGETWFGPTHLIAAMRCYVASKLGDEVEIPEELA
jgi:hypothetical protein